MPSVWCLWRGDLFCFVLCTTLGLTEHALQLVHLLAQQHQHAGLLLVSVGHRGEGERRGRAQGSGMEVFCVEKKSSLLVPRWRRLGSQPRARSGHDGDRLRGASAGVGDGRRRHAQSLILAGSLLQLPRLCGVALLELRGVARAGAGALSRAAGGNARDHCVGPPVSIVGRARGGAARAQARCSRAGH